MDGTEEVFIEKFEVRVIHELGPMLQNFLRPKFANVCNKLECFFLAVLATLV